MLIRVLAVLSCTLVSSCGAFDRWEPTDVDRAFVARFERYCGSPGGGPLGDRTCLALIETKDGRVGLFSGLDSVGTPLATWRGYDDGVRSGTMLRAWFEEEEIVRIAGPGDPGFDELRERYLNEHVPEEERQP